MEVSMQHDGKWVILRQRVQGSTWAVTAVRNTRVFQTETGFIADVAAETMLSCVVVEVAYVGFWMVITIMIVIIEYHADMNIDIFIVDRWSASSGTGRKRSRRKSAAPSCHDFKMR
jgi:hypothetical protein